MAQDRSKNEGLLMNAHPFKTKGVRAATAGRHPRGLRASRRRGVVRYPYARVRFRGFNARAFAARRSAVVLQELAL